MTTDPAHTTPPAADEAAVPSPPVDVEALVRNARRVEKSVPVCLRLDLVAEFEALDRELQVILGGNTLVKDARLNTARNPRAAEIAGRLAELQQEMLAATVAFRFRALAPKAWQEMEDAHPPRKGDDGRVVEKDVLGVNSSTFFPAAIRACCLYPQLGDDTWRLLLEGDDEGRGLSERQYDEMAAAVWFLNKTNVDVPFSHAASRMLRAGGPG